MTIVVTMSSAVEANKLVVRRFFDRGNSGDFAVVDESFSDEFTIHFHQIGRSVRRDAFKEGLASFWQLFPNLSFSIEVVLAEDDKVAVYYTGQGTHKRTGTTVRNYGGVNIYRLKDGRIMEIWIGRDDLTLYQQMGLVPSDQELRARTT